MSSVQAQLWGLLDVASADPERPEQRSDVRELERLSPRQLGGVEDVVATLATIVLWARVARGGKCLSGGCQLWWQRRGVGCGGESKMTHLRSDVQLCMWWYCEVVQDGGGRW